MKSSRLRDEEPEVKNQIDVADRSCNEITDKAINASEPYQNLKANWFAADHGAAELSKSST